MATIDEIYRLFLRFPHITTDSREVLPGSIFFGLKGDRFDGNEFASEALAKGAVFTITDDPSIISDPRNIHVNDALVTLQHLASLHRNRIKAKIIGITGSNGKTTTKELIGNVLSSTFKTVITQGNFNNHIGVPLTLLSVKEDTNFAVIEMGANHPGEIRSLCQMARPEFGIITNIGKAHLEGFGNFEGVIKAKSELYDFIREKNGKVFVNKDNELLCRLSDGMNVSYYGSSINAYCHGKIIETNPSITVAWNSGMNHGIIQTSLYGDYNFENVMAAISVGLYFGISPENISQSVSSYKPVNNRSQINRTHHNTILLDAYNANPSSMAAALKNFRNFNAPSKMIILGDMLELGGQSLGEHREIVELVRKLSFDRVYFVGGLFTEAAQGGTEVCFGDIQQAELWFLDNPVKDMTIMLKGSRKMMLEKLKDLF